MRYFPLLEKAIDNQKKRLEDAINSTIRSFTSRLSNGEFRVMTGKYNPKNNTIEFLVTTKNQEAFADPKSYLMEYFSLVKIGQMPLLLSTAKRGNMMYIAFSLSLGD